MRPGAPAHGTADARASSPASVFVTVSRTRQLLLVLLSVCAAGGTVAVPAVATGQPRHPLVGIADENVEMFSDPRFLSLGIKDVRFYVSWDVLSRAYHDHYRRDILTAWPSATRAPRR